MVRYDHLELILSDLLLPDYDSMEGVETTSNTSSPDEPWTNNSGFSLAFPPDFTKAERDKVVQVHRIWEYIGRKVSILICILRFYIIGI